MAEAYNVGLTPVVKDGHPALTRGRLSHVDQNYVRADTLRTANSRPSPIFVSHNILDGQRPGMVATDTASYSDQVFGLFTLLEYRFSPRVAGLPDQRFLAHRHHGGLRTAGRSRRTHRINLDLITANWPDMLRLAGSLTGGTVRASEILRVTQGGGTPTLLEKALAEYGRIAKTGHLLDFIDIDEGYHRQIHTQLALQESRHPLARLVFHGRRGQIRQSYREGQEDQLGALGLVLNAVITRYLDATLTELRDRGVPVADENVERLSPLASEHINMLGRYTFTDAPAGAPLRPFRHPEEDRET